MGYDKDVYERLIDSSPLFFLDREKECTSYRREALKMVEYLYCYLMAVNTYKYEPYAVEIVDTAKRCIEKYDMSAGRFLNYFAASWKKTYGHLVGRELVRETFKGIHFAEEEERSFRKYMRLAQTMGIDTEAYGFDKKVAEAMGITPVEVTRLRDMINCKPTSGGECEEYSLIDRLDSGNYTDDNILQFETAVEFLNLIELTFDELRERQKPMIATLVTSKLAFLAGEDGRLVELLRHKSFFDEGIFEESIRRGRQIQAREVAERFGVVEASASRSWKTFKNKIKSEDRRN